MTAENLVFLARFSAGRGHRNLPFQLRSKIAICRILRRNPGLDIVRIQDVGLSGADDPTILEWAAREARVLLTHDVSSITHFAYERVRAGKKMPGVFEVSRNVPIRVSIEDNSIAG